MNDEQQDALPWRIPRASRTRAYVVGALTALVFLVGLSLLITRDGKWGEPLFWVPLVIAVCAGVTIFVVAALKVSRSKS